VAECILLHVEKQNTNFTAPTGEREDQMAKLITTQEAVTLIENFDSHQFAGFKTMTIPKLNKHGRVTGATLQEKVHVEPANVRKLSQFVAGIGYSYMTGIQNKLIQEGKDPANYVAGETWHVAYGECKTIRQHKGTGELYFYCFLNSAMPPQSRYVDISNGQEIDRETLVEFLPVEKAPKNQGVEEGNELRVRTFKLSSVKELSAAGEVYTIVSA